ncbi:nitroreductase family protein [Streptomyces sp. FXJ1.4098]|nr:nitroreductase family protein [Streptomyces sp. FXJ1.4098]
MPRAGPGPVPLRPPGPRPDRPARRPRSRRRPAARVLRRHRRRAPPDVHLTLVSRIKRLSWKYAAHSYALTLKNTGVLLQTLSLVATAMGLSGCAVGGGDSETPVRAFGLAAHTEIPVGAFLLGSAAADGPDDATPPASTGRR